VFKERDKGIGIFVGRDEVTNLSGVPVERAKDMAISGCARSRNGFALTPPHPTTPQGRM